MKKISSLLACAMSFAIVLGTLVFPVNARAAATTWYVKYDEGKNDYFFSDAPDTGNWANASELDRYFKEGDTIIVDGVGKGANLQDKVSVSKTIGELAVIGCANIIVEAPRATKAYSVVGSTAVLNIPFVDNAAAYPGAVIQVNGSVGKFTVDYNGDASGNHPAFGVTGTVDEASVKYEKSLLVPGTIYSIVKGKFVSDDDGVCKVEAGEYSLTPGGSSAPAAAPSATPATKQLDAVPKTGNLQLSESFVFFLLAAVFAIGAVAIRKKEN